MAISKFQYLILYLLLATSTSCHGHAVNERIVPLFVFGDSLFDAGNNNYINTTASFRSNFSPYGETFFNYPTGRFSDGRLIPDFIAEYANLPPIQPYLQPHIHEFVYGTNFASAGAGALAETHQGFVVDLKTQLSYLKRLKRKLVLQLGSIDANKLVSNAVYLFSIGSNDYGTMSDSSVFQSFTRDEYVKMVMSNITTVIKGIHKKGGRKFGFMNLAPLGCLPSTKERIQRNQCNEEINTLVKLHNKALEGNLRRLQRKLTGFKYSYFDTYTLVTEIMKNPSKYGFKEAEKACCGSGKFRGLNSCGGKRGIKEYELCENPSEYVFFDDSHPTQSTNRQAAALFWSGTSNVTWPCNLKQLFQLIQD